VSFLRSWRWSVALTAAAPVLSWSQTPGASGEDPLVSMSLERLMQMRIETVYGASKYEQKVTQAPASVTILTGEEIARFGHRTLAEALRSVPGLYVSNDRNYSYLGTRGFLRPGDYNTRILLMMDGHRMNDNIYDAAFFGREGLLSVDAIERVEFVRGPSSSIYGSSAFFGIVNIVTKRAKQIDGAELAASAGSFGGYDGRLSYGSTLRNDVEVTLDATYYSSDGHDQLYYRQFDPARSSDPRATNGGVAQGLDGEESVGVLASAKRGGLTVSASALSRTKDVPTASFGTAFNSPERTTDRRSFLDLKYERALASDLQLMGRLSYDWYQYAGSYTYDHAEPGGPPALVPNKDQTLGSWLKTEWQLTGKLFGRHTLVGGFEYQQSLHQRQFNYDEMMQSRIYIVADDRQSHNAAIFGQGEFALAPRVLLNVGMRYDYYAGSFGGTLNPRVGVIYNPRDRSTFKLLYGEAFRAPSAYERFYYVGPPGRGELEPETIRTYEAVFEQYVGRRDRLNVSVYRYDVGGLVTQLADAEQNIYFDNLTRVTANGIELELERKFDGGALARVSYALQRTEDAESGRTLTNSPRQLVKLSLGAGLGRRLDAGLELLYQSSTATLSGERSGGFLLGNLSVATRNLPHGFQLTGGLYNLLGTRYAYPGAEDHAQNVIDQDGRTVRVKLTRRF
jgi:outer membrane receptor for ferrienterochelin and colicins